jgi:cholesterol oxidase
MDRRNKRRTVGRRTFMRMSAGGAAGLYLLGCDGAPAVDAGTDAGREIDGGVSMERVRVLVIGSGFGGSISALRLAESGIDVTVLERGKRWEITEERNTFTNQIAPDARCRWLEDEQVLPGVPAVRLRNAPHVGLLQKFFGENLNVVCAAGVGGGSLVYSGIMIQPPRDLFTSVFPADVDYTEMDTIYYPRVRSIMMPASMPDSVLMGETYNGARKFIMDAETAGLDVERVPCALDWDLLEGELDGTFEAQAPRGDYLYGLNSGAKRSLDRGYLQMAEATGRVTVRPLHEVTAIADSPEGGYTVTANRINERGEPEERIRFQADFLFVSAGSMNTTKLLLQAKRDGGLPNLNDNVGAYWGNNGQRILLRGNLDVPTGPYQGGPACIFIHHHDNPNGPIGMEYGPAPLGFEHNCLISATQGVPDTLGRLVLDANGEITTDWDRNNDMNAGLAADYTIQQMIDAAGGARVTLAGLDESITFHPLGGATMGRVCDSYGRVMGCPNLYVVDSSLIPGSTPAGNPCWTIAALAERAIETILSEDMLAEETWCAASSPSSPCASRSRAASRTSRPSFPKASSRGSRRTAPPRPRATVTPRRSRSCAITSRSTATTSTRCTRARTCTPTCRPRSTRSATPTPAPNGRTGRRSSGSTTASPSTSTATGAT